MQDLQYADISATYDKWILKPGDSFFEKLGSALTEADYIVAVLSQASVKSQWVHAELGLAMATQLKNHHIQVLPALIQDCDLPPSLANKTFATSQGLLPGFAAAFRSREPGGIPCTRTRFPKKRTT